MLRYIAVSFLLSIGSLTFADDNKSNEGPWNDFSGQDIAQLKCKITDQVVLVSEKGAIPKRYSHVTNQTEVGDTVILSLTYIPVFWDKSKKSAIIRLALRDNLASPENAYSEISIDLGSQTVPGYAYKQTIAFPDVNTVTIGDGIESAFFEPDLLDVTGVTSNVRLRRYFTNNWHGIFSGQISSDRPNEEGMLLATLDCNQFNGNTNDFIIRSIHALRAIDSLQN